MLAFSVFGELIVLLDDYVFVRVGVSRNSLLLALWLLPLLAPCVTSYFSNKHKLLLSLSYMIFFPLIVASVHYISVEVGGAVDFVGFAGAVAVFKLYFALGSGPIILGAVLGLMLSKRHPGAEGR